MLASTHMEGAVAASDNVVVKMTGLASGLDAGKIQESGCFVRGSWSGRRLRSHEM
jgi:hypothetical protein